jgi:outer membrane protein
MEHAMKQHWRCFAAGIVLLTMATSPTPLLAESYCLEDLYKIALISSEKLKLAEQNIALAEIGTDKATSYLYPRLTATGGLTQYSERKYTSAGGILQPDSASAWTIRADETLSLSGREFTALDIARQSVASSRLDVEALREEYLLRYVAAAYYDVLLANRRLEIAEANLERLFSYRDAAKKRLRIGEVTKTTLLRAESELSGAKSDRLEAQNALELAMAILASQVGIQVPFTLRPASPVNVEIPELSDLQRQAMSKRADIKSLEMQKKIAANQIRFTEGALWPTMTITGAYAGADQNPASANPNRHSLYGGIALNFPLFEGGLRKAEVSEARIRERQIDLKLEDLKKEIAVEIKAAHLELATQQGILRFLEDQLLYARENFRAVSRQFESGLADSLDVIDANTLLVSAERKAASAVSQVQLAFLRLKKAAGILLSEAATP